MQRALAVEIYLRLAIWGAFVLIGETAARFHIEKYGQFGKSYFVLAIAWTALLFILMRKFGVSDFVRDMRELYLYDLLIQIFQFFSYSNNYSPDVCIVLDGSIWAAKLMRFSWPLQNANKTAFIGWPPFGILGIIRRKQNNTRQFSGTVWQDRFAYIACVASVAIAYFATWITTMDLSVRLAIVPIALGILYFIKFAKWLIEEHDANAEQLIVAQERADQLERDLFDMQSKINDLHWLTPDDRRFIEHYRRSNPETRDILVRIAQDSVDAANLEAHAAASRHEIKLVWDRDRDSFSSDERKTAL